MSQTQTPNRSRPGQNLDKARQPIDEASHAPGYVYSDVEVFDLEKDRFFMRDWLFVGRVEEFENTGDFLTWRIVGEPIIISRNENGDLNAFYNMCLHRGAEVVQGRGNAHAFSCPYHGGVYDLSGRKVRDLGGVREIPSGQHAVPWDGRDDEGRRVGPGLYLVRVSVPTDADAAGSALAAVGVVY